MGHFDIPIASGHADGDVLLKAFLWFGREDYTVERLGRISLKLFGTEDGARHAEGAFMAAAGYLDAMTMLAFIEPQGEA